MKKTKININVRDFPKDFHYYLTRGDVFDSSCSKEARVYYLDVDGGLFLKTAKRGSLKKEALMDDYFYRKGLGAPEVVAYLSGEHDWLLTSCVLGEDCTHKDYLSDPKRLCDLLATKLRELHETDFSGCPISDHTSEYVATVEKNYKKKHFDASFYDENASMKETYEVFKEGKKLLEKNTLLHGDFCLPNILLDNWSFSGFIDLGNGGVGDRHVDLFWGAWTLNYNLGTDEYRQRFFDAYGRDKVNEDVIRIVSAAEAFG